MQRQQIDITFIVGWWFTGIILPHLSRKLIRF